MSGFNMPPGCSVSDIPGNRPEDIASEAAWEWAEEQLREFNPQQLRRAVLMGKAAVLAEEEIVREIWKDGIAEGRMMEAPHE